jgi:outer membrane protein OmpA-like peptidoglycan-associated protein
MKRTHLAALAGVLLPLAALAQPSPTADSIIRDLRPTAGEATGPTRGIRPAAPAAEAAKPQAPAEAPSVNLMVDFRTGSAELTPAAEHTLDALGRALTSEALGKYRFRIEGHTDTVGTPALNKALSTRRADAVSAYLEKKFAIEAARLDAVGLGADDLPVPTPDQTAEPRNRVVKVVNLGG